MGGEIVEQEIVVVLEGIRLARPGREAPAANTIEIPAARVDAGFDDGQPLFVGRGGCSSTSWHAGESSNARGPCARKGARGGLVTLRSPARRYFGVAGAGVVAGRGASGAGCGSNVYVIPTPSTSARAA